jgi:hypothetical protein
VITVNVERGITSNQLPLSTLLCLIFFTGAHAIQCYVHIRGSIVVISSVRCVSAVLFTLSLSLSGFFGGNNKNSRANAASEFVLFIFIFIFCVFDSVGRHGHPRIIYSDREFSLYIQKWYL